MAKHFNIILFLLLPNILFSQNWMPFGNNHDCLGITKLYVDTIDNTLYGCGSFLSSNNDTINGVARWDGNNWVQIGSKFPSYSINSIIKYNNEIYVGGSFTTSQGAAANYIAKWNGNDWLSVGTGLDNVVYDFAVFNQRLIIVGFFATTNGQPLYKIAQWNNNAYQNVGSPSFTLCTIKKACVFNNELYIGGSWESDSCRSNIARWDGTNWKSLGNGIHGYSMDAGVYSLCVYNNNLYVGGKFNKQNDDLGNYLLKWDGNNFHEASNGLNELVSDMTVYRNSLYTIGHFTKADNVPALNFAKWNDSIWCGLGITFTGTGAIRTLSNFNDELILGGYFTISEDTEIYNIAKWTGGDYVDTCGTLGNSLLLEDISSPKLSVFPNPFNNKTTVEFTNPENSLYKLKISDVTGKIVRTIDNIKNNKIELEKDNLLNGFYIIELHAERSRSMKGEKIFRGKIIIN